MLKIFLKGFFLLLVFAFSFVTTVGFLVFNQGLVTVEADTHDDFLNYKEVGLLFNFDNQNLLDIQNQSVSYIKKERSKLADIESKKTVVIYGPKVSIPKIGVYTSVRYATIKKMADFERQLLYNPVVENKLTADFCIMGENTYLAGHSEPPSAGVAGYAGVNVFSDLTGLKSGDKISVTNKQGLTCIYRVKYFEIVETGKNGEVIPRVFNDIFYPETNGSTWLTIQTCKKGSATERIILRAEMV